MNTPIPWREAMHSSLKTLAGRPRLGLVSDVDGTLSPIVPHPDEARLTPRNRQLLAELRELLPLVALVSGRSAQDLQQRVGLPGLVYVGNHGLEEWVDGQLEVLPEAAAFRPAVEGAAQALRSNLAAGMQVEDKGVSLSVHYRRSEDPQRVQAEYRPRLEEIAGRQGLKFFQGRMVFELRPPVESDKGSAFRYLVGKYRLDAALYLGDDTTDVAALRAARWLRQQADRYGLAVGVLSPETPQAVREASDLLASGVSDVESLLAWLLRARRESSA